MLGCAANSGGRGKGRRSGDPGRSHDADLPRPTVRFRLEAWRLFQRALDPLAKPRPYRAPRPYR